MNVSLENLLSEGLIEAFETTQNLVEQTLDSAKKDLKTARTVFETGNYDWTLAIAYNSMLQAGRALMFRFGYRPKGEYKHLAVVKFAAEKLRDRGSSLVKLFNKARKRRHMVVYELRETVSKSEAETAVNCAESFLSEITKAIQK